jgi:hypothetical protein
MNRLFARRTLIATAAAACLMGASTAANAVFFATICNDLACAGGDDFLIQDNGAGDQLGGLGSISFSTSAFGYTLLVNTSQSKPMVGSAGAPQLDLTFTATTTGAAGNVFLYASDTDFNAGDAFLLALGGTNSGGSGSVTGRAWGGSSNTALQFSGSNLLGSMTGLTGPAFAQSITGPFAATANPFSLTIGATINRTTAGTSTGDLNLQISPAPEPGTWSLMLMGVALAGYVARRRQKG